MTSEQKHIKLNRIRDILLATLDYLSESQLKDMHFTREYFTKMKSQIEDNFHKGRLSKLEQWLRDFIEIPKETRDFNYTNFIKDRTGYNFDIFKDFEDSIQRIIEKGKITTDNQYYDVMSIVEFMSHAENVDKHKLNLLNSLLIAFDNKKIT